MKLLLGQEEVVEKNGIKLSVKVIDTTTQAKLSDLSIGSSIEARIKMIGFMLKNVITEVEIDGQKFEPMDIATKADISDPKTLQSIMEIGAMVIGVAFPSQDEVKK